MSEKGSGSGVATGIGIGTGIVIAVVGMFILGSLACCLAPAMIGAFSDGGSFDRYMEAESATGDGGASEGPAEPLVEIGDISVRVTETNQVFSRFAYVATLKNNTSEDQQIRQIMVEFLDEDGHRIDSTRHYREVIPANSEHVVRGEALINHPQSENVASYEVRISDRHF